MKNNIVSSIVLHNLEVDIYLGWPDEERRQTQSVSIDLKIQFISPPLGCETDDLNDTFCYAALTQMVKLRLSEKPIRLLEYLAREIYQSAQDFLKNNALIAVRVTKQPSILDLKGGASFYYGDKDCIW